MSKEQPFGNFCAIVLLLFVLSSPALRGQDGPLNLTLGLRGWGIDCSIGYRAAEFRDGWPTTLWLSLGGGYEDGYLCRVFDGSDQIGAHTDGGSFSGIEAFKNLGVDIAAAISQAIPLVDLHVLDLFLIGAFRYERRDPLWSPGALVFDSRLPDSTEIAETGARAGIALSRRVPPALAMQTFPWEYSLQGSLHLSPAWLFNSVADYMRLSATAKSAVQLVNARAFELYLAARAGYDFLWGPYLPIHARTTVGGIGVAFFTQKAGLGGAVRGLTPGEYDGTTKVYTNLDLRLRFPTKAAVSPGVTLFVDAGVSDYRLLDGALALTDVLYTTGASLFALLPSDAQIGYTVAYALNEPDRERRLGHGFAFLAHF